MLSEWNRAMNKTEITLSRLGKPYLGRGVRSDVLGKDARAIYLKRGRILLINNRITLFQADYLSNEQKNYWQFLITYFLDSKNEISNSELDCIDRSIEVDSKEMNDLMREAINFYGNRLRDNAVITFTA